MAETVDVKGRFFKTVVPIKTKTSPLYILSSFKSKASCRKSRLGYRLSAECTGGKVIRQTVWRKRQYVVNIAWKASNHGSVPLFEDCPTGR